MSNTQVDDWTLVREKFEALVRERSDNIDDLLEARFCNRFGQLITHATDRARLRAHIGNGRAQAGTRAKIVDEPLDDIGPNYCFKTANDGVEDGHCTRREQDHVKIPASHRADREPS